MGKILSGVGIGVLFAVLAFVTVVAIGAAVNGVSFGDQIVNWFGGGVGAGSSSGTGTDIPISKPMMQE